MAPAPSHHQEPAPSPTGKSPGCDGTPGPSLDSAPGFADASSREWPLKPERAPYWNRAMLRFYLGQAQMWGAIATVLLLFQGASIHYVLAGAAITGLLSLASLVLFRIVWKG